MKGTRLKVLLISHNPITTYNNMGKTFLSLFSAFKPEELCQFYLYPTIPDADCCGSYYCFTDHDALRSVTCRNIVGGEITPNLKSHNEFTNEKEERTYRAVSSHTELARLGRDIIWSISNWNNSNLNAWLDFQSPDIIFVAPGDQELLYDIAITISEERSLPIVAYICDDFYFSEFNEGAFSILRRKRLCRKIEELMRKAALVITICPELAERYYKTFGVNTADLMTCPISQIVSNKPTSKEQSHCNLTYMGNLSYGRGQSILEIGGALESINKCNNSEYSFDVYTGNEYPEILEQLSLCPTIRLHDFVTGDAFKGAFNSADVFVHVESFEEKNRERVRYSISTKIIECLASGRPLLAYGPEDVASMAYLRRNKCAILAQSQEELTAAVRNVLTQETLKKSIVDNALQTAQHEAENSQRLHDLLEGVLEELL